ncbi:MAG: YCF48-related protein [Actinomycetota bacterium]
MPARAALLAAGAVAALGLVACSGSGSDGAGTSLRSVLADRHVHSLAVDPADPERLLLGVHGGLLRSDDGGRGWSPAGLDGDDAMNLARASGGAPVWVAGHEVLKRSADGGATWEALRPAGLPGLDLHGFAVRPGHPREIATAVAGQGLYRSADGGASFRLASRDVGPSVFGLTFTAGGMLVAADVARGVVASRDGGRSFTTLVTGAGFVSVAAHPGRPGWVLAAGEAGLVQSHDGGRRWRTTTVVGPVAAVAAAPGAPQRAYAVAADARVYATRDGGRSWATVGEGR